MNTKRQHILNWQQQGRIDNNNIEKALTLTESNNSPSAWYGFISQSILWLSVLSIAFGVIFFFAYNWNEISSAAKFTIIQGLILLSLLAYTQTKPNSHANTALLFFLALLIGSLFALFGQTYQTGKDPWQLFLIWTVFVTPLALTSKNSILWVLWLVLANLSLYLFLEMRYGFFGLLFDNDRLLLTYAFLNLTAAAIFEFLYHSKNKLINNRIAAQVALVTAMVCFSWIALNFIFKSNRYGFDLFVYLTWMASIYYFYRIKTIDVLILSGWIISGIMFVLSALGRVINNDLDGVIYLLFGLLIVGSSTLGIKWLMSLLREIKHKGEIT